MAKRFNIRMAGVGGQGVGLISLGTSGVIFVATDGVRANPDRGVHAFCHALPQVWHQMAVLLSASSALSWWSELTSTEPAALMAEIESFSPDERTPLFLPYLSGERTPHADPAATASWLGLTHACTRAAMSYAVVEGVSFAFADGLEALRDAGSAPARLLAIGGAARSDRWLQLLADVLQLRIDRPAAAEVGPALGAARLALLSLGLAREWVLTPPRIAREFRPAQGASQGRLAQRLQRFRAAYAPLRGLAP